MKKKNLYKSLLAGICAFGLVAGMGMTGEAAETTMPLTENNIAYIANCGTATPQNVPEGYAAMGIYQSNVDQAYGVDAITGKKWGYYESGTAIVYSDTTYEGTALTDSKRYNYSDSTNMYTYESGVSGIYYNFELPEGTYNVRVGFYHTWETRTADIVLEGTTVGENISLAKSTAVEKEYSVEVTDGELNVKVHNPKRTASSADALLSYIIVEIPIKFNAQFLKEAVADYTLSDADREKYSPSTLKKYDEAYYYASKVANDAYADSFSAEKIESYYNKLVWKYNALMKKGPQVTYNSISGTDGEIWYDTNGTEIQAHGGQIQQFTYNGETKYYWYGEDKTDGKRSIDGGVRVYSSTDLYNWTDEGVAMRNMSDMYDFEEDYFNALYGDKTTEEKEHILDCINDTRSVIERPKVIYNEKTGKYVMWFHADGPLPGGTSNYSIARAGVAVSDTPTGPFKFIDRYRLHHVEGAYDKNKGMARDMTLFVDNDGTGYIIYASEENATLFISKLNEEYTYLSAEPEEAVEGVDFIRSSCFATKSREAPSLFCYNGTYYMLTSGTDGWAATQSRYATADSVFGEWTDRGDPCVNNTEVTSYPANKTFGSQGTNVFALDAANGKFIYLGDRWNCDTPLVNEYKEPKYVWLPVEFGEDNSLILRPYADWTLDALENKGSIEILTEIPDSFYLGTKITLPETIYVKIGTEKKKTHVEWNLEQLNISAPGIYTVTGSLTDIVSGGTARKINHEIAIGVKSLVYFVNAGAKENVDYKDYDKIAEMEKGWMKNPHTPDQAYGDGKASWGYQGTVAPEARDGADIYDSLLYTSGNLTYYFDELEQGEYRVHVGYYDPWAQYATNRKIDVMINDEIMETGRVIDGTKRTGAYSVSMENDGQMIIDFVKKGSDDVLVSWILVEKVREEDATEAENIEKDRTNLEQLVQSWNTTDLKEAKTFALPLQTDNGSKISWSSSHKAIEIQNGQAIVAPQEQAVAVTLTACVVNGWTEETMTFEITVPQKESAQPITPTTPSVQPTTPSIQPTVPSGNATPAASRVTKKVKANQFKLSVTKNHTAYYKRNKDVYKKYTKALSLPVGKHTIIIYTVDSAGVKSREQKYTVNVAKPKTVKKLVLKKGNSKKLVIKNSGCASKITFKSKNNKIATVTSKGKVKAKKKGNTKVIVSVTIGGKVTRLTVKLTVKK